MTTPPDGDATSYESPPPPPYASDWDRFGPHSAAPVPAGTDGFAIASLVLGILPMCGGVLGIVFGLIARSRTARSGQAGRRMAAWGIGLGSAWLVLLVGLGVYGAIAEPDRDAQGALTTSGDVASSDLRPHDCIGELPEEGQISTVSVVPCAEWHVGEVYDTYDFPSGSYPGDSTVTRLAQGHCLKAERSYVGVPAGQDTGWELFYLFPTRTSWALGDRGVACILTAPEDASSEGSAEGQGARGKSS